MTRILSPHLGAITAAARLIQEGKLVAFPTETVYGLGGNAKDDRAIASLFAAKGRPSFNPLIVHVASISAADPLAEWSPLGLKLARHFWPGPLTLILKKRKDSGLSHLVTAGLESVALRMPDHPIARALMMIAERPIAAPSANRSGRLSPTLAQHVAEDLGDEIAAIIDGGPSRVGLESTILDLTGGAPLLRRPGGIEREAIEAHLGQKIAIAQPLGPGEAPTAPGQLQSHYAPRATLRLEAAAPRPDEAFLAFGPAPAFPRMRNLSAKGDMIEAAANFFAMLHELDATGIAGIAIMPIPEWGLGLAINDRLRRAAAPREPKP